MNEQIIKERRRTPWIILGGGLIVSLIAGAWLLLPKSLPSKTTTSAATSEPITSVTVSNMVDTASLKSLSPPILADTAVLVTPTNIPPTPDADSEPTAIAGPPAAPGFTLKTLNGSQVSLSQFRGHPVLINFWASWCAPCRLEMPELVRAYQAHQAEGFVILAVNVTHQDTIQEAQRFAAEFDMSFPVLLDETGEVADNLYQLRGLPSSTFVDSNGLITKIQLGSMTREQIDEYVGEILEE
jgi:cytochrome c biogenesis protein CcmG/thiol:disulfide interchange protein DsbE